jgi:hypothetical protein
MEIVRRHFDTDTRRQQPQRTGQRFENRDWIFRLAPAPRVNSIDQRVFQKLRPFAVARQHGDRPWIGGDQEALEFLVALGVGSSQPVNGNRMKQDHPVETRRAQRIANPIPSRCKFVRRKVVLRHALYFPRGACRSMRGYAVPRRGKFTSHAGKEHPTRLARGRSLTRVACGRSIRTPRSALSAPNLRRHENCN